MADYKDYIVRYDIQADVTKAAEGLRSIADIAKQFEGPMQTLAESITKVSQAAFQLKQNSQIKFAPQINLVGFNNQLRKMVVDVRAAATEMHAAIYEALSGNPMATGAMKKGAGSALSSPKNKAQIKRDIESYERELDKIYGTRKKNKKGETIRNRDGSIYYSKKANMHERVAELEGQGKAIRARISQLKADMAALEEIEKDAATATTKASKKGTAASKLQAAPVTNVTPAVIRQWKQAFGDAKLKNLTINIRGNANGPKGAITVIEQVLGSLKSLQQQASFTINPLLNPEGFAAAESRLRNLASLSAKVVAPFGGQTGKGGTATGKGKKAAGKGAKPLAVDVVGNITSITPPKTELVVPVVGEIIKLQSKVTEAIPLNAKIATGSITESLKGKNRPTIPANIKLMWEKGAVGRQAQLKSISEKIPPIKLVLDTAPAITKLEEFVALIKANSPQNIALTASGGVATGVGKSGVAATGIGTGTIGTQTSKKGKSNQPLTAQERYQAFKEKAAERAKKQKGDQRLRTSKIAEYNSQQKAWYAQRQAMYNRLFEAVPKPDYGWARRAEMQRAAELSAMRADAMAAFAKPTPFEQQEAAATKAANEQRELARKTASQQSIIRHQRQAQKLTAQFRNAVSPWVTSESHLNTAFKYRRYFKEAMSLTGINPLSNNTTSAQMLQYYHGVADLMKTNNVAVPWQLTDQIHKLTAHNLQAAVAAEEAQRKSDERTKKEASKQSISRHQRQADRLRAQAQNSMLPFAQSKEQLNMLTKNRRYFRQAVAATGIMPTAGIEAPQMLRYLQGVSDQMRQARVPIPWQLQSQINKLKTETSNSGGAGRASSRSMVPMPMQQKPFFDRARKWAYPFTGQTSFGARTPMAVDMAKGMGVMFAIGGAMSAIGSSFSQAMDYQNTMRTTQAILQNGTESYSQSAFRNMEATVRNVGVKTKFSAPEVANAARFLAMAGYDIDAINASIRPIADLALIGDSDLGETADKMTNIMTTFGIKPGQMRGAANIMATTATRSNTDLMMLAESAKYGGGVANMYGRNDPNLFADTMALFGVMGNAGIQASSAGTALRMMYQNIFKPNKNQKNVLEMMKSTYGISTLNEDGSYRAMSSILTEMAQRIPENKMAEIVGNLFRITAQPGAAAALLAAAGGDQTAAQEIGTGIEVMSSKMSSKAGLSSLVSLMLANRQSINSNIAGAIAEEKQNTISGLWAQVTSTFTEGIVQAFEQRQGGFEGLLKGLRDYLAKPETITMLQNLLDMVIEIGKVMAMFVKIWAELYNMCPGMIKLWITTQMFFTQLGTLITPLIAIVGVFNRLGKVIAWISGVSSAGIVSTGRIATGMSGAAGAAALNAPFIVGTSSKGKPISIRGNAAVRANRAIANNAILAGELALSGADLAATRASLDSGTRQHYAEVQARAKRMYGWSRVGRAFKSGMGATFTVASMAPMFGGISKMFMGMMAGLAKAVGLLCNPVTLAIAAAGGLAYGIYKLKQRMDGATEAQLRVAAIAKTEANKTDAQIAKQNQWHDELMQANTPAPLQIIQSQNPDIIQQYEEQQKALQERYPTIFNKALSIDSSKQSLKNITSHWVTSLSSRPMSRLALGGSLSSYSDEELDKWNQKDKLWLHDSNNDSDLKKIWAWIWNKDNYRTLSAQKHMVQDALMNEGGHDPLTQKAINDIIELRRKYLDPNNKMSEAEYLQQAEDIKRKRMAMFTTTLSADGMMPDQLREYDNWSIFAPYQRGSANVLDAYIQGQPGTKTSTMNAYHILSNKLYTTSKEMYEQIGYLINGYRFVDTFISNDKKKQDTFAVQLSTLQGGQIDFQSIIQQVKNRVGTFNMTLQQMASMMATVYKYLEDQGLMPKSNRSDRVSGMLAQMGNKFTFTRESAEQYWITHIASNPNSEWIKNGWNKNLYVDWFMQTNGHNKKYAKVGNRVVDVDDERRIAGVNILKAADKVAFGDSSTIPHSDSPSSTPPPPPTNQDVYASHYDKAAARPTVVNININELAHFDRTSVASSAQERDLMAAMEEKIAESIYRLSMTALNNVGGYMA